MFFYTILEFAVRGIGMLVQNNRGELVLMLTDITKNAKEV